MSMKPRDRQIADMFLEAANREDLEEEVLNDNTPINFAESSPTKTLFKLIPTQDEGDLRVAELSFEKHEDLIKVEEMSYLQNDLLASGRSVDFSFE